MKTGELRSIIRYWGSHDEYLIEKPGKLMQFMPGSSFLKNSRCSEPEPIMTL
jgi:hypothetical protein